MNWDRAAGERKQLKGKAKKKWAKLNDDDLTSVAGFRDQLLGRLWERYSIAKDRAEKQVKEWERALEGAPTPPYWPLPVAATLR